MKFKEHESLTPRSINSAADFKAALTKDIVFFMSSLPVGQGISLISTLLGNTHLDTRVQLGLLIYMMTPLAAMVYHGGRYVFAPSPDESVIKKFNSYITEIKGTPMEQVIPLFLRTAKHFRVPVDDLQTAIINGTVHTENARLNRALERLAVDIEELSGSEGNALLKTDYLNNKLIQSWQVADELGFKYKTFMSDVGRGLAELRKK